MSETDNLTLRKLHNIKEYLKKLVKVAIAYSGGVDSTFLLAITQEVIPNQFLAIIAEGPIFPIWETKRAIDFLKNNKINFKVINYNPLKEPNFYNNPPKRCYYCKKMLFTQLKNTAEENGYYHILDGTNIDDINDYRPGLKALKELNILSPLKDVKLGKDEIRKLSKEYYQLPTSDLPSMACLATRIPYGDIITVEKLKKIEKIENYLMSIGFNNFRARIHGKLLRIEVQKQDFNRIINDNVSKPIINYSKQLGFTYITIDLEGYRSGSLNESIKKN